MIWPSIVCSRLSGLLMQAVWAAVRDGLYEQGPVGFAGYSVTKAVQGIGAIMVTALPKFESADA